MRLCLFLHKQMTTDRGLRHSDLECWNIRSQDYSFPGTFVPMMELSFSGPFVHWNIRSRDHSFPGPFVPETEYYAENSFPWLQVSQYNAVSSTGLQPPLTARRGPRTAVWHHQGHIHDWCHPRSAYMHTYNENSIVPRLQSKVQRCITVKAKLHKMPVYKSTPWVSFQKR